MTDSATQLTERPAANLPRRGVVRLALAAVVATGIGALTQPRPFVQAAPRRHGHDDHHHHHGHP